MKYYSALKTEQIRETGVRNSFLEIPIHLVQPEEFFLHALPGINPQDEDGKHGSFVTIFSCWNGMAGTGMITIPWAF